MQNTVYHIPALLQQCIEGLNIFPEGIYADVTFGGGGHSREIISHLSAKGHLYGFDQDKDAEKNIIADSRFTFIRSNFKYLRNFLRYHQVEKLDGVLADLGVSFHHFDNSDRGFSFRFDGKLDMRMNQNAAHSAKNVINEYDEERLSRLFYLFGELKNSRRLASAIVKARATRKITEIGELLEIVSPFINRKQEKKELAQLFQALRIEVNNEMETLKNLLTQSTEILNPGGRLVVLTYHSLEDRLVKNYFKTGNFEGEADKDFFGRVITPFKLINNKVIIPSEAEIEKNPRSRSAKLRIVEKL